MQRYVSYETKAEVSLCISIRQVWLYLGEADSPREADQKNTWQKANKCPDLISLSIIVI